MPKWPTTGRLASDTLVRTRAVTTPLHIGRSTIVMQTNITRSDGKLAAIVTQTQIVLPLKQTAAE